MAYLRLERGGNRILSEKFLLVPCRSSIFRHELSLFKCPPSEQGLAFLPKDMFLSRLLCIIVVLLIRSVEISRKAASLVFGRFWFGRCYHFDGFFNLWWGNFCLELCMMRRLTRYNTCVHSFVRLTFVSARSNLLHILLELQINLSLDIISEIGEMSVLLQLRKQRSTALESYFNLALENVLNSLAYLKAH